MDIPEQQHVFKAIFAPGFVAAATLEHLRVPERSEKHVPDWQIGKIIGVMSELMMNAMRFRSLKDKSEPLRRIDVPVIKKFPNRDQNRVVGGCIHTYSKQGEKDQAAKERIDPDLDGVFVEAGNNFEPTSGMMNLVKRSPEKLRLVSVAMPPVINKS